MRGRGFTLIEVLAALVIVALGMLGAITAVNQATRNGTYLREKTLAHWVAMNELTERRLQASPPDVGETKGEVDFANERWHWTLEVTQTQVRSMRRLDVAVRRASAPEDSTLARVTGFYGSAITPAGSGTTLSWLGDGAPGTGGQDDEEDPPEVDEPPSDRGSPRPRRPPPNQDPEEDPE